MALPLIIREEQPGDEQPINAVNLAAFESAEEADIVDKLRDNCPDFLSFVAERDGKIVGHILFTPVQAQSESEVVTGMGLAPMAVLPEYQNRGVGSALVREGIRKVRKQKYPFIIVLGHPEYYPRFGFEPGSNFGLECEYDDVPDEAFMMLPLDGNIVDSLSGIVKYRPEFSATL